MSETIAIEASGLGKQFRKKWAVRDLTLAVPEGKVYGLLVLNGAGKSTTIRMLMGLLKQSEGSARVLGFNPERESLEIKCRVGYVADTHNFL